MIHLLDSWRCMECGLSSSKKIRSWFARLNMLFKKYIYVLFFFWPCGMWDISSPTRGWTHTPTVEVLSLNHWTTREVPARLHMDLIFFCHVCTSSWIFITTLWVKLLLFFLCCGKMRPKVTQLASIQVRTGIQVSWLWVQSLSRVGCCLLYNLFWFKCLRILSCTYSK